MDTMTASSKTCGCGCGIEVRSRFAPGHDARLKGRMLAALVDATTRQAADRAIDALVNAGWAHFAKPELLRPYTYRSSDGKAKTHIEAVRVWLVDPEGNHHSRHACRQLTRCARRHGLVNPLTRLAMQAAIERKPTSAQVLANMGFDACPECTIDIHLDEEVERWMVGRAWVLGAYDSEGLTRKGNRRSTPKPPKAKASTDVKPEHRTVDAILAGFAAIKTIRRAFK